MSENVLRFATVGHSTRTADDFLEILRAHGVTILVDVRRHPGSRRHPHFDREALAASLREAGLAYRHEERLGGRRDPQVPREESDNAGWESESFRAYADHLNRPPGQRALADLVEEGRRGFPAVMCAEAVPWRCHRQLIGDHLVARGHRVLHLLGPDRAEAHELREMGVVEAGGRVVYPPPPEEQGSLF